MFDADIDDDDGSGGSAAAGGGDDDLVDVVGFVDVTVGDGDVGFGVVDFDNSSRSFESCDAVLAIFEFNSFVLDFLNFLSIVVLVSFVIAFFDTDVVLTSFVVGVLVTWKFHCARSLFVEIVPRSSCRPYLPFHFHGVPW